MVEAFGLKPNQLLSYYLVYYLALSSYKLFQCELLILSPCKKSMNIHTYSFLQDFGSHINLALIQIALYVLCMGLSGELSFVLRYLGNREHS